MGNGWKWIGVVELLKKEMDFAEMKDHLSHHMKRSSVPLSRWWLST